jgi:hypothetical protein
MLVDRLYSKTEIGQVGWREALSRAGFEVSFPHYSIGLEADESNFITINLYNKDGAVMESVAERDLRARGFSIDEETANKLDELYKMARRKAFGVDEALDELLGELE